MLLTDEKLRAGIDSELNVEMLEAFEIPRVVVTARAPALA